MRKQVILSVISLAVFCFTSMAILPLKTSVVETRESVPPKVIVVQFTVISGGCTYTILIAFNTSTGNGSGMMTQNCPGNPPQTIYFNVTNAVVVRSAEMENFTNFHYEDNSSFYPTDELLQKLADGMNDCEEWN